MTSAIPTSAAEAQIPPWLWDHNILRYGQEAQLKLHPVELPDFRWRIEALERFEDRSPSLVRLIEVAAPGAPARWKLLGGLPASPVRPALSPEAVAQKRRELVEERSADDIMGQLNWLHLSLTVAPDEEFLGAARSAFESLRDVASPEGEPLFPDLAAYFFRFDQALTRRVAFPRVMLRVEEEPAMLTVRPTPMAANQLVFGSASSLMEDLYITRDAYLAPLFLCHSPYVWAIVGPRSQGVMVFSLGKPIAGREADAAELLQQFVSTGPTASRRVRRLPPARSPQR